MRTSGSISTVASTYVRVGVDHRDAVAHPAPVDAGPQLGFGVGELGAVVDHDRFARILGGERDHLVAGGAQHGHRVGQVVLALRVLGAQPAQRRREQVAAEAVDRRVDLVDLELLGRRVGVLDDAGDAIVLVAHDAAEAGRVRDARGEHARRRVLDPVLGRELGDRLRPHERRVARQHEDVVLGVEVVEERRARR